MIAEELKLIIRTEAEKAARDLKKYQGEADKARKTSTKLTDTFKRLAGPLAVGALVAATIKLGKEFSKAASAAEEIGSKYATIFRDIGDEAETMANNFAESFGLASSTAKDLLGNTADLLTGLGFTQAGALGLSEQVNTLAVDLASFSNFAGGAEGASMALTKALLGEAESAKALGIVINQNTQEYKDSIKYFTKVEGLTLLQAKAYTALKFATEQSQNAIGDMSRTWESHANVSRRLEQSTKSLKEELGRSVNEGLTPMLSITDKLVRSMADWLKKSNELATAIENFEKGTASGEESVAALNNELIRQVTSMATLNDAVRLNIAGSAAAVEIQKKRIEQTQIMIGIAARAAALEAEGAAIAAKKAKQIAKADEIATKRAKEAAADLANLKEAFARTTEGNIAALESSIAYFETFKEGPMVAAVLEDLKEKLLEQKDTTKELIEEQKIMFEEGISAAEALSIAAAEAYLIEQEAAEAAAIAAEELLEKKKEQVAFVTGPFVDAYSNAFGKFGEILIEGGNAWEVFREAFKESIAGLLDATGKKLVIMALEALIPLPVLWNPAGAALAAAGAAASFTAAGAVRSLATGGDYITQGPETIRVGDNPGGRERVSVTPISSPNVSGPQMPRMIIVRIGSRDFAGFIEDEIDNRHILVNSGSMK